MQTIESVFSLLFLLSIFSIFSSYALFSTLPDASVYKMLSLKDLYRSLSLRGNFQDFSDSPFAISSFDSELETIANLTSKCYFLDGIKRTNCRGGSISHDKIISGEIVVVDLGHPKKMFLTIAN